MMQTSNLPLVGISSVQIEKERDARVLRTAGGLAWNRGTGGLEEVPRTHGAEAWEEAMRWLDDWMVVLRLGRGDKSRRR